MHLFNYMLFFNLISLLAVPYATINFIKTLVFDKNKLRYLIVIQGSFELELSEFLRPMKKVKDCKDLNGIVFFISTSFTFY